MKIPVPLLTVILSATSVLAGNTEQLLDQIKTELKAELKTSSAKKPGVEGREAAPEQQLYQSQELLRQIQRLPLLDEGDYQLQQTLDNLGTLTLSPKIESLCEALSTEMRKAQEKREQDLTEEMTKAFEESLRAALVGKTAKDLDAPLVAMGRLVRGNENLNPRSPKLRALSSEGQQLLEFLRQWQDYLAALDAGNTNEAKQRVQNMINSGRNFPSSMPRSELLSRLNALQASSMQAPEKKPGVPPEFAQAKRLCAAIKTLDQISEALPKLEEVKGALYAQNSSLGNRLSETIGNLQSLSQSHDEIKRGQATRFNVLSLTGARNLDDAAIITPLRYQLLLEGMAAAIGDDVNNGARPDDNPATYLQRVLEQAKSKEDWQRAGRILEVAQTVNVGAVSNSNDSAALRSFLAGLNQERAKQYVLAVLSFQDALKTGSQLITAELIGAHLAAIKSTSPADFELGMELTLNPPIRRTDPRDPRYRSGYSPSGRMEELQPATISGPVLEVPARPAAAAATPAPRPPSEEKGATPK